MKRFNAVLSGLLVFAITLFEIAETKRFATLIAEGNTGYIGELITKVVYILALIIAGIIIISGKKQKLGAIFLTAAGGVAIYKTFTYIAGIMGNEMIFGIVLGNVIDMLEIVLLSAPAAVMLLLGSKAVEKNLKGALIATAAASAVGLGGRIITFISWGKSFASDFALFFEVYGIDLLRTFVMLGEFALLLLGCLPEKRKKHR